VTLDPEAEALVLSFRSAARCVGTVGAAEFRTSLEEEEAPQSRNFPGLLEYFAAPVPRAEPVPTSTHDRDVTLDPEAEALATSF
jgi:hypothetical protein